VCHVNNEGLQNALKGIFMDICMIQNLKLDLSLFRLYENTQAGLSGFCDSIHSPEIMASLTDTHARSCICLRAQTVREETEVLTLFLSHS